MIRKILLSLLILIAATSAAQAEEQKEEPTFNDRKANLAEVRSLRVGYGAGTVRIVLDVTKKVEFTESYAENPSRMILDLKDAWLNPNVQRETEIKSLAAKKIRIAQFDPSTVRIVIETMADTKMFNLGGGTTGHRFVIDIGNAEFEETTEPAKPEPAKPDPNSETVKPKPAEVPKDVEVMDADDLKKQQEREQKEKQEQLVKEQREREKEERELKEKQERELKERQEHERKEKEKQERELKEKQERELKERQEHERKEKEKQERREKKERELKEKKERELKEKQERERKEKERKEREKKNKSKDADKDKKHDEAFKDLEEDLEEITALQGKLIAIDPGHGGNDAGAIGPTGVMEKNVTLKVALELKKLLEAEGATVVMTRETDRTVSEKGAKASDIEELGARCAVGNRAGAHIFISIHADSFTRPEARGTTGYYYSKGSGAGQRLADCIRRNLVEQLGTPSRGTQPCNFYVVKNTDMPATLIELGFISNKEEEKLLDSKEGVRKAAQGILDGIEDYFG